MVGVAPGAPLMTRNIAKKGFDMHLAAGYQLWGALLIPVMIPLVIFTAGKFYYRDIRFAARAADGDRGKTISTAAAGHGVGVPRAVVAAKLQPAMTVIGNVVLTVAIVAFLFKLAWRC